MKISLGKTKIMVLRKHKRKSGNKSKNKDIWKIGDKEVEECETYKYLGVTFNQTDLSLITQRKSKKKPKSVFSLFYLKVGNGVVFNLEYFCIFSTAR